MPVLRSQQPLQSLLTDISLGHLKLPEIQRAYVWKPTQVASLVESLYLGYPTGSFLLWQTDAEPQERRLSIGETQASPSAQPRYLLDGQQRLTSLHRALKRSDALDANSYIDVAFNVDTQEFQNHSAATRRDKRWVAVAEVVDPEADLFEIVGRLTQAHPDLDRRELNRRVSRLSNIVNHAFHIETLTEFDYETVAQIFVRVNSGGRALKITDLALATLSARWPGVVSKFETEHVRWRQEGYPDLDESFLTRLFASAVLRRGLSQWSHTRLVKATDTELDEAWELVKAGLTRLVPILKDIGIDHSSLIPSLNALVPFVMMLGSRPAGAVSKQDRQGAIYAFLVSTLTNRYGGSADTILSRDIPLALEAEDPTRRLLATMGAAEQVLRIRADDLRGRTTTSPYFMLCYLVCLRAGATDWWDGNGLRVARTSGTIEYHHIHPRATLKNDFEKGEINEIANLAFISSHANKRISDRSPTQYFDELSAEELAGQLVPTGADVDSAGQYHVFLARRRELLAGAINDLLADLAPAWLSTETASERVNPWTVQLQWYQRTASPSVLSVRCQDTESSWSCLLDAEELIAAIEAAGESLSSDLQLGHDTVPVLVQEDQIVVELGPVRLEGSIADWQQMLARERADATGAEPPVLSASAWSDRPVPFFIGDTE